VLADDFCDGLDDDGQYVVKDDERNGSLTDEEQQSSKDQH